MTRLGLSRFRGSKKSTSASGVEALLARMSGNAAVAKPKKPRKKPVPLDIQEALSMVSRILAVPPAQGHIERPAPAAGKLVGVWMLPLHLCPRLNALAELPNWARQKLKDAALKTMLEQSGLRRAAKPLPGRPVVRATRFSSVEPDKESSFTKIPVDRLCVGRRTRPDTIAPEAWKRMQALAGPVGLGLLRDDKPSALDLQAWWEPCPPGKGCVYVELWTGDSVAAELLGMMTAASGDIK